MKIQNLGQFLRNKLLVNMTHMKSTNNKDCTFSEKLYPDFESQNWSFKKNVPISN